MKKQKALLLLMVLVGLLWNTCQAQIIPPYGEGQIGLEAVVLCEQLTIRKEPRADSKAGRGCRNKRSH